MIPSFESQTWYEFHRIRWDSLRAEGWEVSSLTHSRVAISIQMLRGECEADFTLPKRIGIRDIHNRMLSMCEAFAAACDEPAAA